MATEKITVQLELKDGSYTLKMKRAGQTVREFTGNVDKTNKSLGDTEKRMGGLLPKLRDFSVVIGLARHALSNLYAVTLGWQSSIINANAELERMSALLRGMSSASTVAGRLQEASSNLDFLIDTAQKAPFSLKELSNSFVKMKSVGIDPTRGALQGLVDAVAAFGGDDQILHRASVAIQQMAGKGIISMEELRQQLGEAVPSAIRLMARSMGLTFQDLVDRISKGQVESMSALKKLTDEFDREFGGAAQRMMSTWSGLTRQLATQWQLFLKDIGDTGYFEEIKAELRDLVNAFADGEFKGVADSVGKSLLELVKGFRSLIDGIKAAMPYLKSFGTVLLAALGTKWILAGVAALRSWTVSLFATNPAMLSFRANLAVMMLGIRAAPTAFAAATTAVGAFSYALGALLGPIGLAVTAVTALTAVWQLFGDTASSAQEKIRNARFGANAQELAAAKEGLSELEQKYKDLQAELEKAEEKNRNGGGLLGYVNTSDLKEEIEELGKTLVQARMDVADADQAFIEGMQRRAIRDMEASIAGATEGIRAEYTLVMRQLEDDLRNGLLNESDFNEQKVLEAQQLYSRLLDLHREFQIEKLEALKAAEEAGNKVLAEHLKIQVDHITDAIDKLKAKQDEALKTLSEPNRYIGGSKKEETEQERLAKRLATALDGFKNKASEAKANLAGLNGEVAKFTFMLESGQFGNAGKALLGDPKKLQEAVGLIETASKATKEWTEAKKQLSTITQAQTNLESTTARTIAKIAELKDKLVKGFTNETSLELRLKGMMVWADGLVAKVPTAVAEIEKLKEALKESLKQEDLRKSLDITFEYRNRARVIRESLLTEREQIKARYEYEADLVKRQAELIDTTTQEGMDAQAAMYDHAAALHEKFLRDTETPLQKLRRNWDDTTEAMREASVGWANDATDALMEFVKTGKFDFKSLVDSILNDLIRIHAQKSIIGPITEGLEGLFEGSNLFGGSGGGGNLFSGIGDLFSGFTSFFGFAKGGIMTDRGPVPLHQYAAGGIANTPQLSVFGEGTTPEAYVPLPDGRNIPVEVSGGMASKIEMHIHGVKDARSFRESEAQIFARLTRRLDASRASDR